MKNNSRRKETPNKTRFTSPSRSGANASFGIRANKATMCRVCLKGKCVC